MSDAPILGVIGGSGLYNMSGLEHSETIEVETPFGRPSAPIVVGELSGKRVAFLARHGLGHHISPTEVNYRANIYALKKLGVKKVVSISACGSLREEYAPGHIVVPDQIFDFTRSRNRSFFGDGLVVHVGTADPVCASLSAQVLDAVQSAERSSTRVAPSSQSKARAFQLRPSRTCFASGHVDHRDDRQPRSFSRPRSRDVLRHYGARHRL
jgi:5'-methylthioadenosine phosphorylase